MPEPPLANLITLGVRDFTRALRFYQSFGWPQVLDSEGFAVFELRGALLALFGLDELGRDARATPDAGNGGIRSSLIIMVDRPEDVDELANQARQAGATITKEPVDAEFFEGRDCYFADPDGHFWEIAWTSADNQVVAAARRAAGITS